MKLMSRIVIIGGHGKVGLLLAPILVGEGHEVVSLIRNPAHADEVAATGASPLLLSVEDAGTADLAAAFQGAEAVVWSAGAGGKGGRARTDAVDRRAAIRSMDAARDAGVRRYIMVSWIGSHGDDPVPADHPLRAYAMAKLDADRYLVASDLAWTILGPGTLTLEPAGGIVVGRAAGTSGSTPTSRQAVAQVVAACLADDTTIGKVIPFGDGDTPIPQAIHDVPREYAQLG